MKKRFPPYVYSQKLSSCASLQQGDIIKVDDEFRQLFLEFYPAIDHSGNEIKHVMLLTQTCDLVRGERRAVKVEHIVVCLVRKHLDYTHYPSRCALVEKFSTINEIWFLASRLVVDLDKKPENHADFSCAN